MTHQVTPGSVHLRAVLERVVKPLVAVEVLLDASGVFSPVGSFNQTLSKKQNISTLHISAPAGFAKLCAHVNPNATFSASRLSGSADSAHLLLRNPGHGVLEAPPRLLPRTRACFHTPPLLQ